MISFSCGDLTSPRTQISLQLLLEPLVIPTTKQNNTDKKLDFSTGRVFVICDQSENTKLSIVIKYILRGSVQQIQIKAFLPTAVRTCRDRSIKNISLLRQVFKSFKFTVQMTKTQLFSNLSHCTDNLPVLKSSFLLVLFCFVVGITGGSKSS